MSLLNFFKGNYNVLDQIECEHRRVSIEDIAFSPFSQMKCLNCGMFNRNWHCAHQPNYINARKILGKFKELHLIWYLRDSTPRRERFSRAHPEMNNYTLHLYTGKQVFAIIKKKVNSDIKMIYDNQVSKGRKERKDFLVFGAGGGCSRCRDCSYLATPRKKCKKPGISFPSLESWGIDVYKTMKNLEIDIEIPPMNNYMVVGFYAII